MNRELLDAFNAFEKAAIAYGKSLGSPTVIMTQRVNRLLELAEAREKLDGLIQRTTNE